MEIMVIDMYLEDFREIVSKLEQDHKESEKYLDSLRKIDSCLSSFICENKYTDILYFQSQFLLPKLLGNELYEWVTWYLYELPCFSEDDEPHAWIDDVGYVIKDLDSFMDFAQHGLKLPMRPKNENV
jgi:hypothetical protein